MLPIQCCHSLLPLVPCEITVCLSSESTVQTLFKALSGIVFMKKWNHVDLTVTWSCYTLKSGHKIHIPSLPPLTLEPSNKQWRNCNLTSSRKHLVRTSSDKPAYESVYKSSGRLNQQWAPWVSDSVFNTWFYTWLLHVGLRVGYQGHFPCSKSKGWQRGEKPQNKPRIEKIFETAKKISQLFLII